MPGISFQSWKAEKVESGECFCTIRPQRKAPILPGDTLYLWENQRSPSRRRLGTAICITVTPIVIGRNWIVLKDMTLSRRAQRELAFTDGFSSLENFLKFFDNTYGLSFGGMLIQWGKITHHVAIDPADRNAWAQSLAVGSPVYVGGTPQKHTGLNFIVQRDGNFVEVVSTAGGKCLKLTFLLYKRRGVWVSEQAGRGGLWLDNPDWQKERILQRAGFKEISV